MMTYDEWSPNFKVNFEAWISYFRLNVHRFIEEYFGLQLSLFQKILIYKMSKPAHTGLSTFNFFASRGIGKTWLTMVFALAMAILYPGISITVVSSSAKTSREFMLKIDKFKDNMNIMNEIDDYKPERKEDGYIRFKNGSRISAKVCNENARGGRTQILILDERNIMDSDLIDRVFDYFLTETRNIPAYANPKYKKYRKFEHNYRVSLTSVGYSDDDAYKEFQSDFKEMISGNDSSDVFSLPYQFGIEAGIIDKSFMVRQAQKSINHIESFKSEAEVIPINTSENAIFNHLEVDRSRQIVTPLVEPTVNQYISVGGRMRELPCHIPKQKGEIRVLSVDIAIAAGKKNDASAWTLFRLFEKSEYYEKNISFHRAINGMNIDNQALYTKRLWHYFDIDYVVIDSGGAVGVAMANLLGNTTFDKQLGIAYPGFKTMDRDMKWDSRVTDKDAVPVLKCITVSGAGASQMQADMAFISKMNFERNRIFLPVSDIEGIEEMNNRHKYMKLKTSGNFNDVDIADNMVMTYLNTNELVREMLTVKLKKLPSGRYTIEENSNDRKDRMISLLYGCYFINQLEEDLITISRKVDLSGYGATGSATIGKKNPFGGRNGFSGGFGNVAGKWR